MITAQQWRALALARPGAEEKSHFGHPDFRVKKKIFAGLAPDGKRGTIKLTLETQEMVLAAKPEVFIPAAGAWGRSGWTYLVLARASRAEASRLLDESYQLVSSPRRPKKR
jgi:predicted DNA-binding protein (MmcQ/YjbR family)